MGFISRLTFSWINKIVGKARKGKLTEQDLPLPKPQTTESSHNVFQKYWSEELEKQKLGQRASLTRALRRSFGKELAIAGLFKFMWSIFVITGAFFFIRSILLYVDVDKKSAYDEKRTAFILLSFFFIDAWLLGLSLQRMGDLCLRVGIRVRAALTQAVSQKAFMMPRATSDVRGEIVQLVAADVQRVFTGIQQVHYLWTAPIEAAAIIGLVASQVGVFAVPGAVILLLVVPLQYFFGYLISKNKRANAYNVNQRVALVQEVLPAIKTVKYYCWEKYFTRRLQEFRNDEKKFQWRALWINTINISIVFCVPPATAFCIFTTYEFANKRLVPDIAFPTLSLLNIMRFPLVVLPKAIRTLSEALTSIASLEEYLLLPHDHHEPPTGQRRGISMEDVQLVVPDSDSTFTLNVPKLDIRPGEVVAVVGPVGSGKSSLLQACLGHMEVRHGSLQVGGSTGYVPQFAWLQNLSLKENITFGYPFDQAKYDAVVKACALETDFQILRQGDQSMAGLRGVNLSGGQRQRVNLARCAYANGDVILLDSPLSAVDYHTAHILFHQCIRGLMKDKSVLLVTHQPEIVSLCTRVMVLDGGTVQYYGPVSPKVLATHIPGYTPMDDPADGPNEPPQGKLVVPPDSRGPTRRVSLQLAKEHVAKPPNVPTEIFEKEKRDARVGYANPMFRSMLHFFKDGGLFLGCLSLLWFLMAQGSRQASDIWIKEWTGDKQNRYTHEVESEPNSTSLFYSLIYFACAFGFWCLMFLRGMTFCRWAMQAGNKYFRNYTLRTFNAPLAFFFCNPVGDLLNVFASDQTIIDESMPESLHYLGIYGLILTFTIFTVSALIPQFFAFGGTLILLSIIMLKLYLPAATQLKGQCSSGSGRLVTLVTETLEGLPIIQAFHKQDYFVDECIRRSDQYHAAMFNSESLNLWLAFFCDFFGAGMVLGVSLFAVLLRDNLGPDSVGLAFSNTIQMLVFYTWVIRFLADTISFWGSVERAGGLSKNTPVEDDNALEDREPFDKGTRQAVITVAAGGKELTVMLNDGNMRVRQQRMRGTYNQANRQQLKGSKASVPEEWPAKGVVEFENVWMRYRYDAGWALRGVTFSLRPQEKVGVVGRTGSGKSTLLLALYGMFPLGGGHITYDGVDTSSLPPQQLRQALAIIPQEPLMFSGSVRDNLDPYGEHNDFEIWQALRKVGLKQYVSGLPAKLHSILDGGDASWSLGQKQLICMARAALSHSPVLCLDEATAALDPATEAKVLKMISELLSDRTTITIAHRLDTIITSDTVMVLEKGEVKEMDRPDILLSDHSGMFSKLVETLGPVQSAGLRRQAREHAIQMAQQHPENFGTVDDSARTPGRHDRHDHSLLAQVRQVVGK